MKLMKLFPVALAALALASCSDDIVTNNVKNVDDNSLYFTMESTTDATRAGVVGDATDALSALSFRWTKGDDIRVYDQNLAMYDVYQYKGESFMANTPAAQFENPAPYEEKKLDSYSIGVYPNSAVEAVYLDKADRAKKHIVMNVPVEYTYEVSTADGKEAIRCDVPMYGNIDDVTTGVTQMNFLTAWTRIYTRNIPGDIQYICVVSENRDQPLTGQFEAQVHYPLDPADKPWLLKKADVEETWGNIMYSDISVTPAALREKGGICFPLLVQKYDNIHIFALKAVAGYTPDRLKLLGNNMSAVDGWQKLLDDGLAIEIDSKEDLNITRRRQCWTVRYTYDFYLDTDAFDPFRPGEVSKVLAAQASNIIGDFKVIPYSGADGLTPVDPTKAKVLKSGPGDYYTHRIEIPQISPLANIILDFSGAGIQYDEALQIYDKNPETNKFSGKLTIIPGKIQGGSDKAKIEVNLPLATVYIVGDGVNPIGNVDVQNAKEVHIGDGQTATTQDDTRNVVFKGGKLYVEDKANVKVVYAQAYAGDRPADEINPQELIVNPGGYISAYAYIQTDCNVTLNGAGYDASTETLYTGTQNDGLASINNLDCSAVPTGITIYSQGDSRIGNLIAPTAGVKLNKLTINTKLFQKSATDKAPTKGRVLGTVDGLGNAVLTGSMLTKLAEDGAPAAGTKIYADEIDMNNVEWTGGAVNGNVLSINYNEGQHRMNKLTDADEKMASTNTGKTIIKNLKLKNTATANGLFATVEAAAAINGLEVQGVKFEENLTASADKKFGALIGEVKAATTIDEVAITGLSFSSAGASYLGGLVGSATSGVTITDADVTGTISGRGFIGGLIGGITTTAAGEFNITNAKTTVSFGNQINLISGTALNDAYAGTFGCFIGGDKSAATIVNAISIYDSNYGTAITKAIKGDGINNTGLRFGAKANESDIPFFGGNAWIGRFVNNAAVAKLTTYVTKSSAAAARVFYVYTYAPESLEKTAYKNTTGDFTKSTQVDADQASATTFSKTAPQTITYSGAASQDHTSKAWVETYKFGTNIFSVYDAAALGYDAAYIDAKSAE